MKQTQPCGPQAFWLRRSLAAGEAEAIKDDIWLSKGCSQRQAGPRRALAHPKHLFCVMLSLAVPGVISRL